MPVVCAFCGCSAARYLDHGSPGHKVRICYDCAAARAREKRTRLASEPPAIDPEEEQQLLNMIAEFEADPEAWDAGKWYPPERFETRRTALERARERDL